MRNLREDSAQENLAQLFPSLPRHRNTVIARAMAGIQPPCHGFQEDRLLQDFRSVTRAQGLAPHTQQTHWKEG